MYRIERYGVTPYGAIYYMRPMYFGTWGWGKARGVDNGLLVEHVHGKD